MKTKNVVLALFADRIDILLCQGDSVAAARRLPVALGTDSAAWAKTVIDAVGSIRAIIEELDAAEAPTTVLYRNPTAYSDYASLPIRSASEARQAAILGCADALACSLDLATTAAVVIGRDATASQSHVVVAADHDDVMTSIAAMVESAGLTFVGATPIDAPIMTKLASLTLANKASNTAMLYVGEQRSFFLIADSGNLLFARPINLGFDALVTSLTRSIRGANGAAPIELDAASARTILHRFGFPNREQVVHETLGLTGAQIIPLLQPVLQRFIVELRQSLRFGVIEEQRQTLQVSITGPGSAIPNFATLIATELKSTVATDESYAAFDHQAPDSAGSELMDAVVDAKTLSRLKLQPRQMARARHINRLRRWLWTGTAAALVLIAADTVHQHRRLADAKHRMTAFESQTTDLKALQATGEKLFTVIGAADKLEARIASETGSSINFRAALQEFSRLAPDSVRLTHIGFNRDKGRTVGRIYGHAFENPGSPGRTQLEPFVEKLKSSPLFDDVVLADVQAGNVQHANSQKFEVSLTGIGIPRKLLHQSVASASQGASP